MVRSRSFENDSGGFESFDGLFFQWVTETGTGEVSGGADQSCRFFSLGMPFQWPSVTISFTVLFFKLLCDGLRGLLDHRLRIGGGRT